MVSSARAYGEHGGGGMGVSLPLEVAAAENKLHTWESVEEIRNKSPPLSVPVI